MMMMMSSPKVQTPRPTPLFFQQKLTFSTKKERGQTPKVVPPPRPPIKSAPPISRIFPRKQIMKATPVSFKSPEKSFLSPHYNASNKELFFDQCFDIECKLGVGSFGEVFKVRSKEDGKLYAVKRSRQRFRGESDRLRKLEEVDKHESLPAHPNCVRFIKAWEEKGQLYIQTELCKTSLNVFAEENHNIPEELIWNYFVDLLMAVKHLHDHDLLHMDIKPENIFISSDNICKLGDFGLVVDLTKDVEVRDAQEGDPKYLAPELMMGQFGKPADIFSLGITVLELAGDLDLPRGGELWHQLRSGILPEEFLSGISSELKEIIRRMMEPEPPKRPTINQILDHAFVEGIYHRRLAEVFQLTQPVSPASSIIPEVEASSSPSYVTPPPPHNDDSVKHSFEWDLSLSPDDGSSFGNNSYGKILDFSSVSSDESVKVINSFAVPRVVPRKANSTPRYKRRKEAEILSEDLCSPPFHDVYSSSPVKSGSAVGVHSIGDVMKLSTPSPIGPSKMSIDGDVPLEKINVEPKNLLKLFESAFCDEAPN